MSLVTRQTQSGLILAENDGGGWAGLRRALRQIDDRLVLWPPDVMSPYWRVLYRVSDDKPAETILTWMNDDGSPRELSSGILERVRKLDRRDGQQGPTADELNQQHDERLKRQRESELEALKDEYRPYLDRGRVGVSMGPKPKRPYYQRRWGGGEL